MAYSETPMKEERERPAGKDIRLSLLICLLEEELWDCDKRKVIF